MGEQEAKATRLWSTGYGRSYETIMTASSKQQDDEEEDIREHLQDVEDGCGCAEIWEHMSEERDD